MNRQAFLEARRAGIGSSDVAKILGLSKWGTALDVYLSKVDPVAAASIKMSPEQEWGIRKEPMLAAAAMDATGWKLDRVETQTHKDYPFLLSSVDRSRPGEVRELVEIKSAFDGKNWGEPETGEVPEDYWIQVQHQLAVAASHDPRIDTCWVFVLIGFSDFRRYKVMRDQKYLETVLPDLQEFWNRVETLQPPAPDWTHRTTLDTIQKMYDAEPGTKTIFGTEAEELVNEYIELGQKITADGEKRDELKARIIAELQTNEVGELSDGRSVVRKLQQRKAYSVEATEFYQLTIKKPKKGK